MFFELGNSRKGIITSISIDVNKLDKDVRDHLYESLGKSVKTVEGKVVIKTNMTLEDLKTLNDGYNEFHSQFILRNVIHFKKQTKDEGAKDDGSKDGSVKEKIIVTTEQKTLDDSANEKSTV